MESLSGQVINITNINQYEELLKTNQSPLVLYFWADFHEPSRNGGQIDVVFTQLALLNPRIKLLRLNAENEDIIEIAEKYKIYVVPTFILIQNGKLVDRMEAANIADLAKKINTLSSNLIKNDTNVTEKNNSNIIDQTQSEIDLKQRLQRLISGSSIMVFMKGSPSQPKCKFSRELVEIFSCENMRYGSFDILTDQEVREALKIYSNWPTYPQIYANTKLIGGLDIIKEMKQENIPLLDQLLQSSNENNEKEIENENEIEIIQDMKENVKILSTEDRIKSLINKDKIMLFMKGSPSSPQCGFSKKIIEILNDKKCIYGYYDILRDNEIRQGIKKYSNWPTFPQLYKNGELIGGLDIVQQLLQENEFDDILA